MGMSGEDQVSKDKLFSGLGSPDNPGLLRERDILGCEGFLVWMYVPFILIYFVDFAIFFLIIVPRVMVFITKHLFFPINFGLFLN